MRDLPKLAWLGAKMQPQSNGGRKNEPGRREEQKKANAENEAKSLPEKTDESV